MKICSHCGNSFISNYKRQKVCTSLCGREVHKEQMRMRRAILPNTLKTCIICNENFTTINFHKLSCSDLCYRKLRKQQYRKNQISKGEVK